MATRSEVELPSGYRWVNVGEKTQYNDLFYNSYRSSNRWENCGIVTTMNNPDATFARMVEAPSVPVPEKEWLNSWE